jgi:membrane-associated phospholipid phosphatase
MNKLSKWAAGLGATCVAMAVAYKWADQPFAFWAHDHLHQYAIFARMTLLPESFPPIAIVIVVVLGLLSLGGRPLSRAWEAALLCSLSLIVARTAKDQLKYVFGRTWPETWVNNNPSLIRDGSFGFNPFHGGAGFESFPSGHTTVMCAVATVLWLYYPRYRIVHVLLVVLVSLGLLGANYHFISDILAGCFLGASIAVFCVQLFRARKPPVDEHKVADLTSSSLKQASGVSIKPPETNRS